MGSRAFLRLERVHIPSGEPMSERTVNVVQLGGLEPPTSGSTDRRSNQLSYSCTRPCPRACSIERRDRRSNTLVWQEFLPRLLVVRLWVGVQTKSPGNRPGLTERYRIFWIRRPSSSPFRRRS